MGRHPPRAGAAVVSLRIERRGGLGGLKASAEPPLAGLSPEQRAALGELLAVAPVPGPAAHRPDRFHYRVRLGLAGGAEQLFELPEDAMPEALAALVKPVLG